MKKGEFIVFEGLEGSGKSTAIQFIKNYLSTKTNNVIYTREPGGTYLSEKIRDLVIDSSNIINKESEILLLYAARMDHLNKIINPALNNGKIVISDRFNWSSLAYQGGGRQLGLNTVKKLNDLFLGSFMADLTLYIDIDPKIGLSRIRHNRRLLDRFEKENMNFFHRTRNIYYKLINIYKHDSILINGESNIKNIEQTLVTIFDKILKRI